MILSRGPSLAVPAFIGCPFHGRVEGNSPSLGNLILPNAQSIAIAGNNAYWGPGSTNLIRRPGLPPIDRTPAQQAQDTADGYQWRTDAQVGNGYLHGQPIGGVNRFVHLDSRGRCWRATITGTTGPGASIRVDFLRFGFFRETGSPEPLTATVDGLVALGVAASSPILMDYDSRGAHFVMRFRRETDDHYFAVEWTLSDDGQIVPSFTLAGAIIHGPDAASFIKTDSGPQSDFPLEAYTYIAPAHPTCADMPATPVGTHNETLTETNQAFGPPPAGQVYVGGTEGRVSYIELDKQRTVTAQTQNAFVFANYDLNDDLQIWTLDVSDSCETVKQRNGSVDPGGLQVFVQASTGQAGYVADANVTTVQEEIDGSVQTTVYTWKRNGSTVATITATGRSYVHAIHTSVMHALSLTFGCTGSNGYPQLSPITNGNTTTIGPQAGLSYVIGSHTFPTTAASFGAIQAPSGADAAWMLPPIDYRRADIGQDRFGGLGVTAGSVGFARLVANKVVVPTVRISNGIQTNAVPIPDGPFLHLGYFAANGAAASAPNTFADDCPNASLNCFDGSLYVTAGADQFAWFI